MAPQLLDQADEDALHKARLLPIEERPFKRIVKRLLTPDALIHKPIRQLATPPPDASNAEEAAAEIASERTKRALERQQWREEMLLDFAALEDSMARIQLLRNSNETERQRYATEVVKIKETAQAVRENTAQLYVQLEEAQQMLERRKGYDKLAEKVTNEPSLKSRAEQEVAIDKLNAEIAELEDELREYSTTWAERRTVFRNIALQGREMLRNIRDEKEEAERKEGMEADDDEADSASKGNASAVGTPRPDGSATPMHLQEEDGSASTKLNARDRLKPMPSANRTSPAPSPAPKIEVEDVDMTEAAATPANGQADSEETGEEKEEGEEDEESPSDEKMDTS